MRRESFLLMWPFKKKNSLTIDLQLHHVYKYNYICTCTCMYSTIMKADSNQIISNMYSQLIRYRFQHLFRKYIYIYNTYNTYIYRSIYLKLSDQKYKKLFYTHYIYLYNQCMNINS